MIEVCFSFTSFVYYYYYYFFFSLKRRKERKDSLNFYVQLGVVRAQLLSISAMSCRIMHNLQKYDGL